MQARVTPNLLYAWARGPIAPVAVVVSCIGLAERLGLPQAKRRARRRQPEQEQG